MEKGHQWVGGKLDITTTSSPGLLWTDILWMQEGM